VGTFNLQISASGYGASQLGVGITAVDPGGGGDDGGTDAGTGADGGGVSDSHDPSHLTINGYACASSGGTGAGGSGGALAGLIAGLLLFGLRRRRAALGLLGALLLGALPVFATEPAGAAAPSAPVDASAPKKPAEAKSEGPKLDPLVAVLNFKNKVSEQADKALITTTYLTYLVDIVRGETIKDLPGAKVMTSENMEMLVQAAGKKLEDCEGLCEVETGRLLGAELVVTGDVLRVGSFFKLLLKMHDTQSSVLVSTAEAQGRSPEDLGKDVKAAVADLFKPVMEQRREYERQAAAKREAERKDREQREAAQRTADQRAEGKAAEAQRAADLRAAEAMKREQQLREEQLASERREQEIRLAETKAQAAGTGSFGGLGIYGGMAWDPKASTMGGEAGLKLRLGAGWSLAAGALLAPHPGARVALYATLDHGEHYVLALGLRGMVVPLPDGTAFGGGAGLRLSLHLTRWLSTYTWAAGEVVKTSSETLFAPLLTLGLELHL
jgi:MYXO-CTERM domain-containing protein